jgi:hypothetical protein
LGAPREGIRAGAVGIYEWEVDRLGVVTSFTDSIYLDEGEYGTFVMEY